MRHDAVLASTEFDPSRPRDPRVRSLRRLETPAPPELVAQVRELVDGVEDWGGWPNYIEVANYSKNLRFLQIRAWY